MKRLKLPATKVEDEPRGFRKFYNRCREYCILVWCWLRSRKIDQPPQEVEQPMMSEVQIAPEIPHRQVTRPLLEKESLQESCCIPLLPRRVEAIDMLFLGLDSSGISSTAKNLFSNFGVIKTENETTDLEITEISEAFPTQQPYINLRVIDVPGLCKGRSVSENAEIVLSLNSYLKSSLPNKIPTATFIISRFDDNRFAGEGSDFSKMLLALSHSQMHWTDNQYSNVVLVLTHGSKVKENIPERIAEFQNVFHTIFPKQQGDKPIPCVVIDNSESTTNPEEKAFTDILMSPDAPLSVRNSSNLQQYLEHMSTAYLSTQYPCIIRRSPISNLLPPNRRDVNELMAILLQGVPYKGSSNTPREDESFSTFCSYFPSFPTCRKEAKSHDGFEHHVTKLLPDMRLLLGDGVTTLPVSKIVVGNKLFNKEMSHGTVTRVKKIAYGRKNPCNRFGIHFYRSSDYEDDVTTVFKYTGRSKLRPEKLGDEFLANYNSPEVLYEVEINYATCYEDNFIVDGYVAFASVDP